MIQHRNVPIQTQATVELQDLALDVRTEAAFWKRLWERYGNERCVQSFSC